MGTPEVMQPKTESMFTTDDFAPSPVEAYLEKALKNCTNGLRSPGDEPACKKQKLDVYSEPAVCDKQEARENSKPAVGEKQETKENSDPAVYEKQKTAEKVEPAVCEKQAAEENRPPPRTPPREVSSSPFCDTPPPGENDVPPPIEKNIAPTCEPPSSAENGQKSYVDSNDEDADDPGVPDESSTAVEDDSDTASKTSETYTCRSEMFRSVLRNIRAESFEKFTKSDLEELLVQKICESIAERAVTGELKRKAAMCEDEVLKWKTRALDCIKQVNELKMVVEKCSSELDLKKQAMPLPSRVSRSVGLQVSFNSNMKLRKNMKPAITEKLEAVEIRPKVPPASINRTLLKPQNFAKIRPKPACKIMPYNSALTPASAAPDRHANPNNKTVLNVRNLFTNSQVVDLTDEEPEKKRSPKPVSLVAPVIRITGSKHPAPMPITVSSNVLSLPGWKSVPPRPILALSSNASGIVLSWDMPLDVEYEKVGKYQLFAYQETAEAPHHSLWRLIGEVKALSLPMACTLQCFIPGFRYHFAVRGVDVHQREGTFSWPGTIVLKPNSGANSISN